MARRRSRIEGLKGSFVVTVTVATAGCGGTVSSSQGGADPGMSTGGAAGAAGAGAGGDVIRNPPAPFDPCPTTIPVNGAGCYVAPTETCAFAAGPCTPTTSATCQAGQWVVTTDLPTGTCNPPPPPDTVCPPTIPAGGYCNYQGPPCSYGPMCGSFATQTASCVNNTWMMSISSCNPPPPPITTCPTIAPITGGYCDYAGAPCHYDYCNLPDPCVCWDNRMTATCSGNQWTVEAMCDPPLPDGGTRIPQDAGAD